MPPPTHTAHTFAHMRSRHMPALLIYPAAHNSAYTPQSCTIVHAYAHKKMYRTNPLDEEVVHERSQQYTGGGTDWGGCAGHCQKVWIRQERQRSRYDLYQFWICPNTAKKYSLVSIHSTSDNLCLCQLSDAKSNFCISLDRRKKWYFCISPDWYKGWTKSKKFISKSNLY